MRRGAIPPSSGREAMSPTLSRSLGIAPSTEQHRQGEPLLELLGTAVHRLVLGPRHLARSPPDYPALKSQREAITDVWHRISPRAEVLDALLAIKPIRFRLAGPISDQAIDHDVVRPNPRFHQPSQAPEENRLILLRVPGRIEPTDLHRVIAIVHRRDCFGGFLGDHPSVDALVEAH